MRPFPIPARRVIVTALLPGVALILILRLAHLGGFYVQPRPSKPTLQLWYATDDPSETPLITRLVSAFQLAHAGTSVRLTTYSFDDMNSKMQLALKSGTAPDLVYTTPRGPGLPMYVQAHQLTDMQAVARASGWSAELRPGLLQTYNDALSPTGKAGTHVYAVPYVLAAVSVLYNATIFNRLHLTVPEGLAQLEQDAARATATGVTAFGIGTADGWLGDDWYLTVVNAIAGPRSLAPELQLDPHFSFKGPPFIQAAQLLRTWSERGYFTPQFGGLDAQDSIATFFEGKTAMQLISSTENGQVTQLAAQTHLAIGVFAFPSQAASTAPVMPESGYAGWAIPRTAAHPGLAEAFISQMLTSSTAQSLLAHGLIPARRLKPSDTAQFGGFQRSYLQALTKATPGVYLDGAPIPNLNATMEANVQLLLQHIEAPSFLVASLQTVYSSGGRRASSTRTDGEF